MLYILIITLVLLIPALIIYERDSIHKKDWQGANDERNTIPSFREGKWDTVPGDSRPNVMHDESATGEPTEPREDERQQ